MKALTPDQLTKAQTLVKRTGVSMGVALINLGFVSEAELLDFLGKQYGVRAVDLSQVAIERDALKWLPQGFCEKYIAIPVSADRGSLVIAMADPSNGSAVDDLKFLLGSTPHEIVVATETAIRAALKKYPPSQPVG